MKKIHFIFLAHLFLFPFSFWAQDNIAQKEILGVVSVGTGEGMAQYGEQEDGYTGLGGPYLDSSGTLYLIHTSDYRKVLNFRTGRFSEQAFPRGWPNYQIGVASTHFQSQQGITVFSGSFFSFDGQFSFTDSREYIPVSRRVNLSKEKVYPTPWGLFIEFPKRDIKPAALFVLERLSNERFRVREGAEAATWVTTQPGDFTIGTDGFIYRQGMLWSAINPPDASSGPLDFLARLGSGHTIWTHNNARQTAKIFFIARPSGEVEKIFNIDTRLGSYGVGPWGELYYIEAPTGTWIDDRFQFTGTEAKLYVIRSYLREFGRLNDGGVRLRSAPNTSGEILGTFPNKTGFRILERSGRQETIGGRTSDWVKVRLLDGREGWFFGAFVQNLYDGPNGLPPPWPNVPDW